ncbi:MAG: 50S ribosomal protein L9 [Planctomycetes bacterium RIFCSPHIGHO2_12_FULL_52_36]|nr:MAG: 50S ribosomal protein L9 [Planctomycetes bacterium RIFCSPHIGHO2_02_FULL_52_58]OHB93888.1 MAG: 50S ribosomal protein L9 [Planctomycetes bacterium RIFCSPHIGHO2_12_FULL_52_36]
MQVILMKDVEKLGSVGDVVDVTNGYARNYLLPRGLVALVSPAKVQEAQIRKKKEEGRRETEKKDLQSMAQGLAGQEFTLKAKATDEGKLFGSISPGVVTQELLRKGYTVEESAVALEENIKECGTYTVQLKFPHGVTAQIKLSVTKEE